MTNIKAEQLHAYALHDRLVAAINDRSHGMLDVLDLLRAFTGTEAERDARAVAVRALTDDQVTPQIDVDLALWREYAATDLNADDTVAPWDFDDGSFDYADHLDRFEYLNNLAMLD